MYFWTWPRTAFGVALGLILAGLAAVAYRQGWAIAENTTIIAGLIVFVAVSGRLTTMRNLRWKDASWPISASARVRRGRVVIREFAVFPWIMLVIVAAGWILLLWMWSVGYRTSVDAALDVAFMGPLAVLFGIPALAPKLVVTPTHVRIDRAFTRNRVPRQAMQAVRLVVSGAISIEVRDQRSVEIQTGVWQPAKTEWDHRPAQLKYAGRFKAALDAVPRAPAESDLVVNERRPVVIALAVLAAVTFTTLAVLVLTGVIASA